MGFLFRRGPVVGIVMTPEVGDTEQLKIVYAHALLVDRSIAARLPPSVKPGA